MVRASPLYPFFYFPARQKKPTPKQRPEGTEILAASTAMLVRQTY